MNIAKYLGGHGQPFDRSDFKNGSSYIVVEVLPELKGKTMNHVAMGWISALQPTWLRITTGEVTIDSKPGRITVFLKQDSLGLVIDKVEMECNVLLPDGVENGYQLRVGL